MEMRIRDTFRDKPEYEGAEQESVMQKSHSKNPLEVETKVHYMYNG